jgi:signal transduction histidine kinase
MRTRLLLVLLSLVALLLIASGTLLAQSYAAGLSQTRFFALLGDAGNLAGPADAVLREGVGKLRLAELLRNDEAVHDVRVTVIDSNGDPVPGLEGDTRIATGDIDGAKHAALAGQPPARPRTVWPWRREPLVVGAPVGRESQIVGAVIVVAPTDDLRGQVADRLLLLAAGGSAVLLLVSLIGVLPLARWILRPVEDLATAVRRITAGDSDARVPEREGPPELRGLAAAFNRMAESVSAALERQRAFAADASHQLRNPLTTLRLRIDNLALHVKPAGERDLHAALSETDRLAATIDVLLDLARAEATADELHVVDVAKIAAGRVEALRPAFADAGIALRLSAPEACPAYCHAAGVEQALDALLDNARKFGGSTPVEVTVAAGSNGVRVRVRDHGPGLSEAERSSAGERFWRSPRHQNVDGTGLGLTIARALLANGGGRLELHDALPGLAADIVLPALDAVDQGRASR